MESRNVVTRFAPSPTGYFHAGSYRTALFSWIFARQKGGTFILRIEDTDKERSKKEYEDNIVDSLKWLGLNYDHFYRQSDRTDIYKGYIHQLIESGHAYVSNEEKPADSNVSPTSPRVGSVPARSSVIRFRNPNKKVIFDDMIRGRIEFDTTELGDFVIAKSEDEPIFHLVVVIDDHEMGVTHIIRGEDHISNTPRQILIYEAIGAPVPRYAHIPLLLSSDRSKLSKRKGAIPVSEYRSRGYLREAIVNYLALLGWHPSDDREIMSVGEIVSQFSLERVQKAGAVFDDEKLRWFNRQYILNLSDAEFAERASPFLPEWISHKGDQFGKLILLLREKISTFDEVSALFGTKGELAFVRAVGTYEAGSLLWKKQPDPNTARAHLTEAVRVLSDLADQFTSDQFKQALWAYVETHGKGDVLWPLRMALTGQERSPDPFVCASIIGREEALERIHTAIDTLA